MKHILFCLAVGLSVFINKPLFAGTSVFPQGDFSELRVKESGKVSQVIDPQVLQFDDRRLIRLQGIDLPDFNDYKPGIFSVTALKVIRDMVEGQMVNVYQPRKTGWGQTNRMGQQLAHLERKSDRAWVQGTLLRLGLARVMTDQRNPEMANQMYPLERAARAEKAGIWGDENFKILAPDEAKDHIGTVRIVEGTVRSASLKQNRIYLNFGPDWKTDFTVTIPPENRSAFFDRAIDPLKWNGKKLRVRGWIGSYNGPYIEIDHPERIEVIADDSGTSTVER